MIFKTKDIQKDIQSLYNYELQNSSDSVNVEVMSSFNEDGFNSLTISIKYKSFFDKCKNKKFIINKSGKMIIEGIEDNTIVSINENELIPMNYLLDLARDIKEDS